jgi:hypothetical protein
MWGDEFKHFKDVGKAADEIGNFCIRWGRIDVGQTKEKFGEVRCYCSFGHITFYRLLYPGAIRCNLPKWIRCLDAKLFKLFNMFGLFNKVLCWWQYKIYNMAYKRAVSKYPYIREEILSSPDYPELLRDLRKGKLK